MNQDIFNTQLFQKLNTLSDNPLSPTTSASESSFVPKSFQTQQQQIQNQQHQNQQNQLNQHYGQQQFAPQYQHQTSFSQASGNPQADFNLSLNQQQQQYQAPHYPNDVPFSQTRHQSISATFDPFNTTSSLFFPDNSNNATSQLGSLNQQSHIHFDPFSINKQAAPASNANSAFQLPLELQGGISSVSSRRPSYTAEFFNRDVAKPFVHHQQQQPSQTQQPQQQQQQPQVQPAQAVQTQRSNTGLIQLDNGLLLQDNFIITSKELQQQFYKTINYFGDLQLSQQIVEELTRLCDFNDIDNNPLNQRVLKILKYLKFKNDDLKFQTKNYTLILNKNNKIDLISIAKNSNLRLAKNDLIIIEGDRGKDLVLVLEPVISANFAILFNYLKKKLHLKSLTYGQEPIINNLHQSPAQHGQSHSHSQQQHHSQPPQQQQQQQLINEDENFITLPNKQILRFVKPFEINQLYLKFNDELMTLKLCLNYILNLNLKLIIRNVEFQFDKKKIIIYYYCNKRLDFRGLIKELFKIYKTRIWLCAILPHDDDAPYIFEQFDHVKQINDLISLLNLPHELQSINDFMMLKAEKFHGEIFQRLIKDFTNDIQDDQTWSRSYHDIENYSTNPSSRNGNGFHDLSQAQVHTQPQPQQHRSHRSSTFSNGSSTNATNSTSFYTQRGSAAAPFVQSTTTTTHQNFNN